MHRTTHFDQARPARTHLVAALAVTLVSLSMAAGTAQAQGATPAPTPSEAVMKAFKHADKDNDGKLSRNEAEAMPAVAARFAEFDKDKDGFLSLEEFSAGVATG